MTEQSAKAEDGTPKTAALMGLAYQITNPALRESLRQGIEKLERDRTRLLRIEKMRDDELAVVREKHGNALIRAETAAAGKSLPNDNGVYSIQTYDELRECATAIIAAREATIRELEAKCAGMKEDAERWRYCIANNTFPRFHQATTGQLQTWFVGVMRHGYLFEVGTGSTPTEAVDAARAADGGVK